MTDAPTKLPTTRQYPPQNRWLQSVGFLIFFSRWLQAPLYLGLIVAQVVYVVVFITELVHLAGEVFNDLSHIDESMIMLSVLGLIDVVMIANLLIMVIIGGYETFVSKIKIDGHPDQPEWLSHVNANVLKVKLAMAIIGISSIHLLKTFIEVGDMAPRGEVSTGKNITGESYTWDGVMWQVIIHMVFIVSAIALAWIDKISRSDDHHQAPVLVSHQVQASVDHAPTANASHAHTSTHVPAAHVEPLDHSHGGGQHPHHTAEPERERV
ncbi:TIGR00645 family protein [Leifsonia kafniensis]|uniref:UPF0114 protein GCM10022381_19480 n=1 Tax=Leifsonia kafniensis TaxID=475957 RepID=A0ABP7KGL9_9MICO